MGEQVTMSVREHDVRDDLLIVRVVLDLRSRLECVMRADHRLVPIEPLADEVVPRTVRKDVLPPDAEHLLRKRTHHAGAAAMRTRPRPNTAISSAVRSTSSSLTGRK